jgi:hypothetical protein
MNEITRVRIDFKDFHLNNMHTYTNQVDWAVYSTKEPPPFITKEAEESLVKHKTVSPLFGYGKPKDGKASFASYYGAACFYAIVTGTSKCSANRIAFYPRFQEANKNWANRFLNLCKIYKFLPEYIEDDLLDGSKRVVLDLTDLSISQTYLYLCIARYPQEFPYVAYCTVELVDKYGLNFLLAFSAAHYLFNVGNGHSLQEGYSNSPYYSSKTVEALRKTEVDILHAAAWKKYLDNPLKYDKRKIIGAQSLPGFNLQQIIRNVAGEIGGSTNAISELYYDSKINQGHLFRVLAPRSPATLQIVSTIVFFECLFDEDVIAAVMADSIEETREKMKIFRNKNIIYVDEPQREEKVKKPRKPRIRKAVV